MALTFCDGFDSYAVTADLPKKWARVDSPWAWSTGVDQNGVTDGIVTAVNTANAGLGTPANAFGVGGALRAAVGFWLKVSATPASSIEVLNFPGYFLPNPIARINITSSGFLQLVNGSLTPQVAGTTNVCDNVWHWVEITNQIGNLNHRCLVDGVSQWNANYFLASVDAFNSAVFYSVLNRTISLSDPIFYNDTGTLTVAANFPLGPRKITTRRPNADDVIQFTRSAGASSFVLVDELGGDDSDYVESGTLWQQDTYDYEALGFTPSVINAVMANAFVVNPVLGSSLHKQLAKSGAVVTEGVNVVTPSVRPTVVQQAFHVDPSTGAAWTQAGIDVAKFGIKLSGPNTLLLVTGIGANGDVTFPDTSGNNYAATKTGTTQLTTTTPISGCSSSIVTDGAGDVRWANAVIDDPGAPSVPWTVEMLWKPLGAGSVCGYGQDWGGAGSYGGFIQAIAGGSFRCYNGYPAGLNGWDFSSAAGLWTAGSDYFLCMESSGAKVRLYLGLKSGGTFTMIGSGTPNNDGNYLGAPFRLGSYGFAGGEAAKFNHLRISRTARYNSDSGGTIPVTPFTPD